ncbi:MAG: DNA repair protein RecO [Acidimicrobiales bacterium]
MSLYRAEGVVLRTYKLGETDRIVVFMTAAHGKVRAVAKGVRKIKSRFGGRLESPNRLSLLLYEGRELHVVTQAETLDHHRALREDLGLMTEAMSVVEAVDQLAQDHEPNPALYRMLVDALATLARRPSALLVAGFYWKALALEGMAPVVDSCVRCGAGANGDQAALVVLDWQEGGALCSSCRVSAVGSLGAAEVTPGALRAIQLILGGQLRHALATPAGPVAREVTALATGALEAHLERRLRVARTMAGTGVVGSHETLR